MRHQPQMHDPQFGVLQALAGMHTQADVSHDKERGPREQEAAVGSRC